MSNPHRRKAQIGLLAVGVMLIGCLSILMLPGRTKASSNPEPTLAPEHAAQTVSALSPKM